MEMISWMKAVLPYISGLYTLPWILVGFLVSMALQCCIKQEKIDFVMKKIGLVTLYFFVAPLIFRIFLDAPIGTQEEFFFALTVYTIVTMYLIAWIYARYQIRKQGLSGETATLYLKTVITNQGRSSAFVGGAMLAIPGWGVPAGIFMAMVGIALFAVMPYILYHMNKREQKGLKEPIKLPWFLRYYPWYFSAFVIAAIIVQKTTGLSSRDMGDAGVVLRFYTALTIPIALYYVGSGMHPNDLKVSELKKLIGLTQEDKVEHWQWVRQIFLLTAVYTPLIFAGIFGLMLWLKIIPGSWFAVILINTLLPITSTNMFLVPYGLDKRATAHAVTWSTLLSIPLVVVLIWVFSLYFG